MTKTSRPVKINWETLEIRKGTNLPHWSCKNAIYHVSFRLADSIPAPQREEWLNARKNILKNAEQMERELSEYEIKKLQYLYSEKIEIHLDSGCGECYLAKPKIGKMVVDSLEFFNEKRYQLHACCVMPNHVHVIVEPSFRFKLEEIVHSWKSFTANKANIILNRNGIFWQHEPYDHIIRSEKEYYFQIDYVWNNPGNMKSGFIRKRYCVAGASSSRKNHEQDAHATLG